MILAGAGTGKTRVITYRTAYLIENGIPPWQILAVTFTNKAAREMQERIAKLVPREKYKNAQGKIARPLISTFHSLCVRILRMYIDRLGYKKSFVIYTESDQLSTLRKIMSHIHAGTDKADIRRIHSLISNLKNNGLDSLRGHPADVVSLTERVLSKYESSLRACNAVDFDDLILLTLKLFQEHPDVLEECSKLYQYIMVDEYQDTNSSQFQLINLLAGKHRNLCVVGDDDQSIYGWRGAQISNLLDLEKFYPEVKIIKLEQNYRSTNIILKAANTVIRNNARRRSKNLWSQQETGDKIGLSTYESDEEEAQGVVDRIEHLRIARGVPWEKQAILFRTNQQSRPIETALRKARIKYNLIGGQSFFDRSEIKDLLAYLKTFINPQDDISLLRIANNPPRGLSDVTLERLLGLSQEHGKSVYEVMGVPEWQSMFFQRTRNSIAAFYELITSCRNKLMASPVGFDLLGWLEEFFVTQEFYAYIKRCEKTAEAADNRIENIRSTLRTLDKFTNHHSPLEALELFLEEITLDDDRNEDNTQSENAVTLITMHSCKGLEYPCVHIVGMEEGILPHARSKIQDTLDEERRLFYVAITRAKKFLYLSHCTQRKRYGEAVPCHPSQFLRELPPDLITRTDAELSAQATPEVASAFFANIFAQIRK